MFKIIDIELSFLKIIKLTNVKIIGLATQEKKYSPSIRSDYHSSDL